MRYLHGFFMTFGMFCSIPCPYRPWDEKARNLTLVFLPLVGLVMGGIWYGLCLLTGLWQLPLQLQAAVMMVYPYLVSGFIHLDGFMDTSDAILSQRPLEERLRILKDPHTGAFSIISLGILFVLCYGAAAGVLSEGKGISALIWIPVITRVCAGMAVLCLRPLGHSSYSGGFRDRTTMGQKIAVLLMGAAALTAAGFFGGAASLAAVLIAGGGYICFVAYAVRNLGGMSGDLSGYALTMGEACGLLALAIL